MASNALELDSSELQPIPEQIPQESAKVYRSSKPLPLKMEVISRFTLGQTKSKIARDLDIEHNTVNKILRESKIEEGLFAGGRFGVKSLVLDSVAGLSHHVGKKSLKACTYVLDNTIFKDESGNRQFNQNLQVNVHIPRPDSKQFDQPIIEAKAGEIPAESTAKQPSTKL